MEITGPFKISVVDDPETLARELHLNFTPEFRALDARARADALQAYSDELQGSLDGALHAGERQGMLTMLQIAEQLLPHVATDELPVDETIVVELRSDSPLAGLLGDEQLH